MKRIIFIVISCSLLASSGCKKCYRCSNSCFRKVSTGETICNTDFMNYTEYYHVADSLGPDVDWGGGTVAYSDFSVEVCSQTDLKKYETMYGISCTALKK